MYSIRTAQKIVGNACNEARIKKQVTIHSRRHSLATHPLESGVDLRCVQELLGHKSSKMTEIYGHIAMRNLSKINSPLDLVLGSRRKNGQKKLGYADQVRGNTKFVHPSSFDQEANGVRTNLAEITSRGEKKQWLP